MYLIFPQTFCSSETFSCFCIIWGQSYTRPFHFFYGISFCFLFWMTIISLWIWTKGVQIHVNKSGCWSETVWYRLDRKPGQNKCQTKPKCGETSYTGIREETNRRKQTNKEESIFQRKEEKVEKGGMSMTIKLRAHLFYPFLVFTLLLYVYLCSFGALC